MERAEATQTIGGGGGGNGARHDQGVPAPATVGNSMTSLDLVTTLRSHGSGPRLPPRPRARRGARAPARHRPLRPFGRQPTGLAGDRDQGPGEAARAARPLPRRVVRVPGHGLGRTGPDEPARRPAAEAAAIAHAPEFAEAGAATRASPRRWTRRRRSCSSWPTSPRWPPSTVTSPATPSSAGHPSTPSSGACCWRPAPRASAA